jgi:hypothetical protein
MSLSEPGCPYFAAEPPKSRSPFAGARLTTAGVYRLFPITVDSPHEPWCMHFEWGPCSCAPQPGEVWTR